MQAGQKKANIGLHAVAATASFPSAAAELELHERMLEGHPLASVDMFKAMMEPLIALLRRDRVPDDEATECAADALLVYFQDPSRFDRRTARLSTYVGQIAKHKAVDRMRSRQSRQAREENYGAVVELRTGAKISAEDAIDAKNLRNRVRGKLPAKEAFVDAVMDGEDSTVRLAEILEIGDRPKQEKKKRVKQAKDRVMKALRRLGERLDDDAG